VRERSYVELDIEPKGQVTSGEQWRSLDVTPLVEHYPSAWFDLEAEAAVARTHQRDGLDSLEFAPRIGARLHLLRQALQGLFLTGSVVTLPFRPSGRG
jgi:hypothetical protein